MTEEIALPRSLQTKQPISAVALVGFMGAGKTTVGQALAKRLGRSFTDLDRLIESREGRTIEEIFQEVGEAGFRMIEQQSLQHALNTLPVGPSVLALGGGAFIRAENRRLLASAGVAVVCLDALVEELFRRCEQPGMVRPLRRDWHQFRELYESRRLAYGNAELQVATSGKDIPSIVEEIISRLNLVPVAGASQ